MKKKTQTIKKTNNIKEAIPIKWILDRNEKIIEQMNKHFPEGEFDRARMMIMQRVEHNIELVEAYRDEMENQNNPNMDGLDRITHSNADESPDSVHLGQSIQQQQ